MASFQFEGKILVLKDFSKINQFVSRFFQDIDFYNLEDQENQGNHDNLSSETNPLRPVDAQHGPYQIPRSPPKKEYLEKSLFPNDQR